jgi:hypothetical protein
VEGICVGPLLKVGFRDGVVVGKGDGETVGAVDMVGLLDGGKVT